LDEGGAIVCLIKPQFELGRDDISKGGIVRDPALHEQAVEKIRGFVTRELGHAWLGLIPSPITGTDGNQEFLAWLGPCSRVSNDFLRTGCYDVGGNPEPD